MFKDYKDQFDASEWENKQLSIICENDHLGCEYCDSQDTLCMYLRKIHPEINSISDYPDVAFGLLCGKHVHTRKERISEIFNQISLWGLGELDTFCDAVDVINSIDNHRPQTIESLYNAAKRSKYR